MYMDAVVIAGILTVLLMVAFFVAGYHPRFYFVAFFCGMAPQPSRSAFQEAVLSSATKQI